MKIEAFSPFRVSKKRGKRGRGGVLGLISRSRGLESKGERGEGKLTFL
jgi:hypothetical protein